MARYIGKCSSCKTTSARDYTESTPSFTGRGADRRPAKILIRTTAAGRQVRPSQDFECQRCGEHRWNGKRVEGFVTDHNCDARCTDAKGFNCECACGGANHGAGWIVCEAVAA